jgi:NAD(P)-dependent dehydrogenase (short-subunit alcohol dehydrogenase family)
MTGCFDPSDASWGAANSWHPLTGKGDLLMGVMDGKVAIVTGAGHGVGRGHALDLAEAGAKVLVNDLGGAPSGGGADHSPADEVVELIRSGGGQAVANYDDVSDFEAARAMVRQAVDTFGGLDALILNAGILRDKMIFNMDEADWDNVIKVHLKGHFAPARHACVHWRERTKQNAGPVRASVICTSSSVGLFGNIGQTNYAAAKLGIMGLSRVLAMEGASKNVRSNIIAPTAWTRLIATIPVKDEAGAARMKAMQAALRPDQPAKLAVALASPAAKDVTGQIFGARSETLELFSQPRPVETVTAADTWTVASILSEALPKMAPKFTSLGGAGGQQAQQRQPASAS